MTERPALEVFDSAQDAAAAAAAAIVQRLHGALVSRGEAHLCVTGGTSPGPVYDLLKDVDLDWRHVALTLSDERCVPETSDWSNARLVRERLLTGKAAAARFKPLRGEGGEPDHEAWTAELAIAPLVPFDAVLLGMGEDGHIASLFPGNPMLEQGLDPAGPRLVLPVPARDPAPAQARISLTLPALMYAELIVILVRGEAKRAILERDGDEPVHHLIRAANRGDVRLLWSA
ncbi:MAG TPA: 6-phosphogluconolactonase [Caulobacter sp.]|nr:6-phosphogluconolactonase [Caulobacter sp.]